MNNFFYSYTGDNETKKKFDNDSPKLYANKVVSQCEIPFLHICVYTQRV